MGIWSPLIFSPGLHSHFDLLSIIKTPEGSVHFLSFNSVVLSTLWGWPPSGWLYSGTSFDLLAWVAEMVASALL